MAKKWQNEGGPWGRPSSGGSGGGGLPTPPPPPRGPRHDDFDSFMRRFENAWQRFTGGGQNKRGLGLLALVALLLWLASGIYIVDTDEQGVVTRFGKFHRITQPGPNYHLPIPIEQAQTPKVTSINREEIGFRSGRGGIGSLPEESLMLTGDENIVDINFEVQWKIRDAGDFLFNVRSPRGAVKAAGESAMREVIGKTPVATILSEGKLQIEQDVQELIQAMMDDYKTGVLITKVNMLKAEPPEAVIEAFRDVQRAQTDQERARNEAEAYRNDIIPRARGQAAQMIQEAEAYREQVTATAEGDAARFLSIYEQYKVAKDVTKKRMYLETMEQVMTGMGKVIVDKAASAQGVVPILPLPDLRPAAGREAP